MRELLGPVIRPASHPRERSDERQCGAAARSVAIFKQVCSTVTARAMLTSGRCRCWKGNRTGGCRSCDRRIRGTDSLSVPSISRMLALLALPLERDCHGRRVRHRQLWSPWSGPQGAEHGRG
jgi:hypothetical protein